MTVAVHGSTSVFGILGWPVSHSFSPILHNAGFAACGFPGIYVPFPVETLDRTIKESLRRLQIKGLSITIPHKHQAYLLADESDTLSELCGAANTWIIKDKIHAMNTDGPGALRALKEKIDPSGARVALIGYGGSASGIAHELLLHGNIQSLEILGRDAKKRSDFVEQLKVHSSSFFHNEINQKSLNQSDILIHTTPVGMKGYDAVSPLDGFQLTSQQTVFDIVYNPRITPLLKQAEQSGCTLVEGWSMLYWQAILQFEAFTGQTAPLSVMKEALLKKLYDS